MIPHAHAWVINCTIRTRTQHSRYKYKTIHFSFPVFSLAFSHITHFKYIWKRRERELKTYKYFPPVKKLKILFQKHTVRNNLQLYNLEL